MKFIDEIGFSVCSGKGGDGCISFRREKHVPRGGPDGGDGGRGGAIVFEATRQRNTLVDFRRNKTYRAGDGEPGRGRNQYGKGGKDLTLLVPVGTVISDASTGESLADLATEGDTWRLPGGTGGKGNTHFKSSRRRTPHMASPGEQGIELRLHLELKLLADVGLLGFPNAGKSTFISRVSAAKPRVANYPFTTLTPSLGVVEVEPGSSFVVADIPGLIEGASEGIGLGHQFLRHVERCEALAHLVSVNPHEDLDIVERWRAINNELRRYDTALVDRPQILLLSQVDLVDQETLEEQKAALQDAAGVDVIAVSSVTGTGIRQAVGALWRQVVEARDAKLAASAEPTEP